jgi:hypothetical protein
VSHDPESVIITLMWSDVHRDHDHARPSRPSEA